MQMIIEDCRNSRAESGVGQACSKNKFRNSEESRVSFECLDSRLFTKR